MFLFKELTKNACDRVLKLVRKENLTRSVCACDELLRTTNESEYVGAYWACEEDFFDFLEWQGRYYLTLEGVDFNSTHMLVLLSENDRLSAAALCKKDHSKAPVRTGSLFPTKRSGEVPFLLSEDWKVKIASALNESKVLTPTLLRPAKKVELCSKWGNLLPKEDAAATSLCHQMR